MQGWVWFSSWHRQSCNFRVAVPAFFVLPRISCHLESGPFWSGFDSANTPVRGIGPAYADYCEVYFILILSLEDQHSEKVIMLCLFHNTSILFPFIYLLFSQPDWEKLGDPNLPLLRRRRYCWDLMSPLLHHVNVRQEGHGVQDELNYSNNFNICHPSSTSLDSFGSLAALSWMILSGCHNIGTPVTHKFKCGWNWRWLWL